MVSNDDLAGSHFVSLVRGLQKQPCENLGVPFTIHTLKSGVICSSPLQGCCREVCDHAMLRLSTQGLTSWGKCWFCAGHLPKMALPDYVMLCLQEECGDSVGGGYASNMECWQF